MPEIAPTMERFRVLEGMHVEPVPGFVGSPQDPRRTKKYKKGDIVESNRDLAETFPNKFHKLSDEEFAPPVDLEARRKEVNSMIESGTWQEEDRRFLEHLSEENFRRLQTRLALTVSARASEDKTLSTLGTDVTSNFTRAYDEGFKVFKNAKGKFQVTARTEVNKPLNKEALDKDSVDKFVDQFLKEK
jgi:hypothetical protein